MENRNTLVTGATGLIGHSVVRALAKNGETTTILVRTQAKAERWLGDCNATLLNGDLTDPATLEPALDGVDVVYHAAGIPEQWLPDSRLFHQVNVKGTANLIEAALNAGVKRFVYTSTIDVFAAQKGDLYDETMLDPKAKGTVYEQSKQDADRLVVQALEKRGLPAIFVHPAAVYGPGPTDSPGINDLVIKLRAKQVPLLLPGGMPLVYSEDLGRGQVLAAEKGAVGDRFIFSESYYTLKEIAQAAYRVFDMDLEKTPPMMPLWLGKLIAVTGEGVSAFTKKAPLVPRGQLHFMQWGAVPINTKAKEQLGWQPRNLEEGMAQTIQWLREENLLQGA